MTQYKREVQGNRNKNFEAVRWYGEKFLLKIDTVIRSLDEVRRLSY